MGPWHGADGVPFLGNPQAVVVVGCTLCTRRYHLTVRILRGEMHSLAVERNALSHISCLMYDDSK